MAAKEPRRGGSARRERGSGGAKKAAAKGKEKKPIRERAHEFAFEGLPEKDRFGIFDPALRGSFLFLLMLVGVFLIGGAFDAWGQRPAAYAAAGLAAAFLVGGGYYLFRRIWPTPVERELLLQMAREDDEARALTASLTKARAARAAGEAPSGGDKAEPTDVDRSADASRKAF